MAELKPVRPNAGIRIAYAGELTKMLKAMNSDIKNLVKYAYEKQEKAFIDVEPENPIVELAQDAASANPVDIITKVIRNGMRKWMRRWDAAAERIARDFVSKVDKHSLKSMQSQLKRAGFTVKFDKTQLGESVIEALVQANVALIKSIPEQYHTDVTGIVMRGVTDGTGAFEIGQEIDKRYAVSKRRAMFIARDQTNKATESIKRQRDTDLGIRKGRWIHVPGLKTSRHTHKKMNGKEFLLNRGLYDSDVKRYVLCGELPGCQCTYAAIVPEFGEKN